MATKSTGALPTIREIARAAGCSVSVVSRALSPKPDKHARVAPTTRERIEQVARELGYRPNRAAEFLKRGLDPAIAAFLPDMPNRLVADLIFGLSEAAADQGFPLRLAFGLTLAQYRDFLASGRDQANCGIVTYPYFTDRRIEKLIDEFRSAGGNVVMISPQPAENVPVVAIDDRAGAELAAEHLWGRGCRRFLTLSQCNAREKHFAAWVERAGGTVEWLAEPEAAAARLGAAKVGANQPWGIFAATDRAALRLCRHLGAARSRLGRDLLLIGFDDLDLTGEVTPALTTIHQPFRELGELAMRKLINVIYGRPETGDWVKPRLVVRETA